MRLSWWVLLVPTVAAVVALMAAPPMSDHGQPCDHPAALIVISPGYTDGEMASYEPEGGNRTCSAAAWRASGFAVAVGTVGAGAAMGLRWLEKRQRASD